MVGQYMVFLIEQGIPSFFNLLDSFNFGEVSWLALSVAVSLLGYFIGSILMRV